MMRRLRFVFLGFACCGLLSAQFVLQFATSADAGVLSQVLSIVMFTIPGVLLGGQLGPMVQATVDPDRVKLGIAVLFMGVGVFMLFMVL